MAAGDVTVDVVDATASAVDTALTTLRAANGSTGKYMAVSVANGTKVMLIAIAEA